MLWTPCAAALKAGGKEYVIFDENEPNPPIAACNKGYEICVAEKCDFIIGVGGGSNMDCAKGINILRFNPGPLIQYANFAKPFEVGSGLIMVPTTSGTGSEVSDGSILSDENHIKQNFIANGAYADYCILDYDLLVGMPPKLTCCHWPGRSGTRLRVHDRHSDHSLHGTGWSAGHPRHH